jgi:hypothetical protein
MRRQIGKGGVLIDPEVIEHPAAADNFRLPDQIVGLGFNLDSQEELLRSVGEVVGVNKRRDPSSEERERAHGIIEIVDAGTSLNPMLQ